MDTNLPILAWDSGRYEFQRKLGNFVQYFQVNLPINGNGIPLQLIDPVIIAENMLDCETTDDMSDHVVHQAIINVEFEEGLPVVDGVPIWERLDGEPVEYYKLFKEYREALYAIGIRAISKLAAQYNIPGKHLSALSKVYHWQMRCRAYDLYKKMEQERIRQMEIEKLEHRHAKAAEKMLEQGLKYLEEHPEQLNTKAALQMIQIATRLGRLALGLHPEKPDIDDDAPRTSINIHQTTANGDISTTVEIGQQQSGQQLAAQDVSNLQAILHILDKAGALDKAKATVIDAEYTSAEDVTEIEATA